MRTAIVTIMLLIGSWTTAAEYVGNLQVGDRVYEKVFVLSANASALSIKHSGGLTQVALADLPRELQVKYGYDEEADASRAEKLDRLREKQVAEAVVREEKVLRAAKAERIKRERALSDADDSIRRAFSSFGEPAILEKELDLRAAFRTHGIGVRRQRGPSCSVHAIVAALEFQYAEKRGKRVDVSEDFLVLATSKALGRGLKNEVGAESEVTEDEGFALEQVFQAIRGYGLALERDGEPLSDEEFEAEFKDVSFSPFLIPGSKTLGGVNNIVHVLNAKMPVVVGMAWPHDQRVRHTSLLSKQPTNEGYGHAVTLVGYLCETGKLEDVKFIFRNSWGIRWGAGGYGFVTAEYLMNNLYNAYVVELR